MADNNHNRLSYNLKPSDVPPSYNTLDFPARSDLVKKRPLHPPKSEPPSSSGIGTSHKVLKPHTSRSTATEIRTTILKLVRDLVQETDRPSSVIQGILQSCAETSSAYGLSLSDILQEKSIRGHTPLYWAIVKCYRNEIDKIPDLLHSFITFSKPVKASTISDIRLACISTSNQCLHYHLLCKTCEDEELLLGGILPSKVDVVEEPGENLSFTVQLSVPRFQERMMVFKEININFIARRRMWNLHFFVATRETMQSYLRTREGAWCIGFNLEENSPPADYEAELVLIEPSWNFDDPLPDQGILSYLFQSKLITHKHKRYCRLVVSLEDNVPMGPSLQYAGSKHIGSDGTLRAVFRAKLIRDIHRS